jgi:VWFA-related protein
MYRVIGFFVILYVLIVSVAAQNPTPAPQVTPPRLRDLSRPNTPGAPILRDNTTTTRSQPTPTPAGKAGDDEIIRITSDLVTTPVSVLDKMGRFIPNLKKKDFQIFDNGVQQQITYFQSSEMPFTVVLLIDISPSTKYKIDEIHYAALTFVNQLRAEDKVMVVAFDQRIRVLTEEPTSDKTKIYSAIYKANFGSGTSLYEAVGFVTDLDMIKVTGRKAVVLFTDGVDTTSRMSSFESTLAGVQEVDALFYPIRYNTEQDNNPVVRSLGGGPTSLPPDIQAMLQARGITIDPRAIRGNTGANAQYARGKLYLDKLAENTGGRIFEAAEIKDLEAAFKGVAEELRRQYSIGYAPDVEGQAGERRSLNIKVPTRPGAVIRSKKAYVIRSTRSDAGTNGPNSTAGK